MIRENVRSILQLAAAPTLERLRRDRQRALERLAPLFRYLEEHLFDSDLNLDVARRASGVGQRFRPTPDRSLAAYVDELRIETAVRLHELSAERIPTGRLAAAVGLAGYRTWQRVFRRTGIEPPSLVRLSESLRPRFDVVFWHRLQHRALTLDESRELLHRLDRSSIRDDEFSAVTPSDATSDAAFPRRSGGITDREARLAAERAAQSSQQRLLNEAAGLPADLTAVLADVAEHLLDPDWTVEASRQRAEIRDTAVTTKIRFHLGETLADVVDRARVDVAVQLVADRRFTVKRLAEAVGWSFKRFTRSFRRRTGTTPGEIRETLKASIGDPMFELWRRAAENRLAASERRTLDGYLRSLHGEELLPRPPAELAIRHDVDPRRVDEVLDLYRAIHGNARQIGLLDKVLQTHPDYSAAHWYSHWIRDRLGCGSLDDAWEAWRRANRDLCGLLRLSREERLQAVRDERRFQDDAFLWLLVDSIYARLFHDTEESEHIADLAVAAAETRRLRELGPASAGFCGLMLAFKGKACQRRNSLEVSTSKFDRAFAVVESTEVDPWSRGLIHSLHASTQSTKGEHRQARRSLFKAGGLFKKAEDELERIRCVVKRAESWFASAKNPTKLLTACIAILDHRFPFEFDLRQCTHINRLLSVIYLTDQLTGRHLAKIQKYRIEIPSPTSPQAAMNCQYLDGLLAALAGDVETATARLIAAASWFEEQDLLVDAAVCRLQYAWAALDIDSHGAKRAAQTAFSYFQGTGFKSHSLEQIAFKIQSEAEQNHLAREMLRQAVLLSVCPKLEQTFRPSTVRFHKRSSSGPDPRTNLHAITSFLPVEVAIGRGAEATVSPTKENKEGEG